MSVVQTNDSMSTELDSFKDSLDSEFEIDTGKQTAESMVYRLTTTTTVTTVTTSTVFL